MGSLCCVAARSHGSNAASRDWSMGPHEPFWHTNTSFSPPPSRWDIQFQSEGLPNGWHDGVQLYGSSTSSNSKESRSWISGNHLYTHHNSASDGAGLFLSSPSDISLGPQWTPPAIQEINVDDYETATKRGTYTDPTMGTFSLWPAVEGASENPDSGSPTFSHSDSSETEPTVKFRSSSNWNFSSCRSFMSKPIHPLAIPTQTSSGEAFVGFTEFDSATHQRDTQRWSSASSSVDFADVAEAFELEIHYKSSCRSDGFKCGLCEKLLSQRSPWGSRRIVRSGDMPIAGVLSCRHVFHAECLEETTPKTRRSDPPCPLCLKPEDDHSPEQKTNSRLRNTLPRPRPSSSEDTPPRPWGCAQVGDCVEGALQPPPRNSMLLLNRTRTKNLSFKGNPSKEFPGKLRKSGSYSSRIANARSFDQGFVGCSKTSAGPSVKR